MPRLPKRLLHQTCTNISHRSTTTRHDNVGHPSRCQCLNPLCVYQKDVCFRTSFQQPDRLFYAHLQPWHQIRHDFLQLRFKRNPCRTHKVLQQARDQLSLQKAQPAPYRLQTQTCPTNTGQQLPPWPQRLHAIRRVCLTTCASLHPSHQHRQKIYRRLEMSFPCRLGQH